VLLHFKYEKSSLFSLSKCVFFVVSKYKNRQMKVEIDFHIFLNRRMLNRRMINCYHFMLVYQLYAVYRPIIIILITHNHQSSCCINTFVQH
jgi:hypothetical protein